MNIQVIQAYMLENKIDGWLMADFHGYNLIAAAMLKPSGMVTRKTFYFIPAQGEPTALIHAIEKDKYKHLPGNHILFSSYKLFEAELEKVLEGSKKIAMEYAPMGRLPYIGLVDAGTIEMIRSFGKEVVTSANLVANFQARLSPEQIETHRIAAKNVIEIKEQAFAYIADSLKNDKTITEYDVVKLILAKFDERNMETADDPNCSVDGNAGNPHYEPSAEKSEVIKKGQLVLIDLWGKLKDPNGIYADIAWVAYAGTRDEIPKKYVKIFSVLIEARNAAVDYINEHIGTRSVYGSEVDDAAREVVEKAGYGKYFTHRTGHSITDHVHGSGPMIDNLETADTRELQQGHLFSIEPGIYMDDCGFRTEIDVLIGDNGAEVYTLPYQTELLALLD